MRPTELGELKIVTGEESWSYSTEAGRGIEPKLARQRLEAVESWPENVPPVPDWAVLDGECFRLEDLPTDYKDDENPCLIELAELDLELTEEQRDMLRTPEERIKDIQFPHALQNRVKLSRNTARKNRWGSKFRGQFVGKLAVKWNKAKREAGGRDALESKSRGVAKAKAPNRAPKKKSTFAEKLKQKQQTGWNKTKEAKKKEKEGLEPCEDSPWHNKIVRVTEEGVNEGRHGRVQDVWRVENCEGEFRLRVLEVETGAIFQIQSKQARGPTGRAEAERKGSGCRAEAQRKPSGRAAEAERELAPVGPRAWEVVVEQAWKPAKPGRIDWRVCRGPRRTELAKHLAIMNCEFIDKNRTLELGTVRALMGEIEERVGVPEGVVLVEPTISITWAREDQGDDEPTAEEALEQKEWNERIENAEHLLIVVHSENPAHYTYLKVTKQGANVAIEYRDALKKPSGTAKQAATRILRKLHVLGHDEECPAPSNKRFQVDGWSCGLWTTRWIERALREIRGEGRQTPDSITDACARGNEWIQKLQDASDNDAAKAKAKAKAKTKGKAKTTKSTSKHADSLDAEHTSLEVAMKAAASCTKCEPQKDGAKGCRACMGEQFEAVRKRGFMARAAKTFDKKVANL